MAPQVQAIKLPQPPALESAIAPLVAMLRAGTVCDTMVRVRVVRFGFFGKLYLVEVLPNIKIWRLAPNFDIWKDFNYSQFSVKIRRTSTDEI